MYKHIFIYVCEEIMYMSACTNTHTHTYVNSHTRTLIYIYRERQTDRETERQKGREKERESGAQGVMVTVEGIVHSDGISVMLFTFRKVLIPLGMN